MEMNICLLAVERGTARSMKDVDLAKASSCCDLGVHIHNIDMLFLMADMCDSSFSTCMLSSLNGQI